MIKRWVWAGPERFYEQWDIYIYMDAKQFWRDTEGRQIGRDA